MYLGFVFQIENISNGKVFIGKTLDIDSRIRQIFITKNDSPISKAIQEEGKENFKVSILHTVVEHRNDRLDIAKFKLQDLYEREVRKHKCIFPKGYNQRKKRGIPDDQLENIPTKKVCYKTYTTGRIKKPITMFDASTGKILQEFESLTQAGSATGICLTSISKNANGYNRYCQQPLEDGTFRCVIFKYLENCN